MFYVFSMTPRGGARMDPRGTVGRIYKRTTIHSYTQNMKALGLVVSEKQIIFYVFFSPLYVYGS